jgi:hypothetical protein
MTHKNKVCPSCDGAGATRCKRSPNHDSCDAGYDCNRDGVFDYGDAFISNGICFWPCRECSGVGTIQVELAPLEQLAEEAE